MRDYTRFLRNEKDKDIHLIWQHNNSKIAKRTPKQNEQAYHDKMNFYLNKWDKLLNKAETRAQKDICNRMINDINKMPKCF